MSRSATTKPRSSRNRTAGRSGAAARAAAAGRSKVSSSLAGAPASSSSPAPPKVFALPDGTRSLRSPWVWRGLLLLSFVALGLCLTLAVGDHVGYAVCWGIIASGWFGTAMWLWVKTIRATA